MMLRFLVKFLLLAIILAAAVMLTAQWKLEKDIDSFARAIEPFAVFEYESAKINLTGEVKLNSVSLYIDSLNSTIEVGELKLFAGNLYELAFLENSLRNRELPENAHLIFNDVLIPFNPRFLRALSSDQPANSTQLLQSAFCGDNDRIDIGQIEAMGYDYLSFSGKEFFLLDKYSGSVVVNGNVDFEEMFDIEYQFNISGVMAWLESIEERRIGQYQQEVVMPTLGLLEVRVKDRGFNRKKAEFCAIKESVEPEEYYTGHQQEFEKMLSDAGIEVKESAKQAYARYIQPDSELHWFMQPKANFDFEGVNYYSLQELLELSRLRVSVNGEQVGEFFEGWSPEAYKLVSLNYLKAKAAENPQNPLYREVIPERSFQVVVVANAANHINDKVKVQRDDGRMFEGELDSIDKKSLWVRMKTENGMVTLPVAITRVVKFEVYQ